MKFDQQSLHYNQRESNSQLFKRISVFVLKPIFIGLFAFAIFFTTILITKVSTFLLAESSVFNLNIYDVLFAMIGFAIGFFIEFLLQIRRIIFK